ncbi:MAG: histidine phosphatase family protein [Acidimicrobiales bacterium]
MTSSSEQAPASARTRTRRAKEKPSETFVVLVRHGKTPTTGQVLPGRAEGLHLSDEGHTEAAAAADRLFDAYPTPTAIFASPLERAQETAAPYGERTGLPIQPAEGLLECDFGEWTGGSLKDLSKTPEWKTVQGAPSRFRFPGGESFTEMSSRIVHFLEEVEVAHRGGVVVCFSHADPIKAAIADALGLHLDQFQRINVTTASISVLAYHDGRPTVVSTNTTPLLPRKAH